MPRVRLPAPAASCDVLAILTDTRKAAAMEGWIDEVDDGIVYGRVMIEGGERVFWIPLRLVSESARVDLQPGSYVTILNGELAVNGAIWTTHDMETADAEAVRLHAAIH